MTTAPTALATATTHTDNDAFEAWLETTQHPSDVLLIRDAAHELWTGFDTEDGAYAVRPRHEDDEPGPEGDRWRPVGPVAVEGLEFPLVVAYAAAVTVDEAAVRPGTVADRAAAAERSAAGR